MFQSKGGSLTSLWQRVSPPNGSNLSPFLDAAPINTPRKAHLSTGPGMASVSCSKWRHHQEGTAVTAVRWSQIVEVGQVGTDQVVESRRKQLRRLCTHRGGQRAVRRRQLLGIRMDWWWYSHDISTKQVVYTQYLLYPLISWWNPPILRVKQKGIHRISAGRISVRYCYCQVFSYCGKSSGQLKGNWYFPYWFIQHHPAFGEYAVDMAETKMICTPWNAGFSGSTWNTYPQECW